MPAISIGDELVLCENDIPETWMKKNIFNYIGNENLESSQYRFAYRLSFFEDSNLIKKPSQYSFKKNNNEIYTITSQFYNHSIKNLFPNNKLSPYEIKDLSEKEALVNIESFYPIQQEEKDKMKILIDSIKFLRKKNTITFNLCGNSGGNSGFGSEILKNLFGEKYYEYHINTDKLERSEYIDWKISDENFNHLLEIKKNIENNPDLQKELPWIMSIIEGFVIGIKQKDIFFRELTPKKEHQDKQKIENKALVKKIFLLVDSNCVSATLDFIDEILLIAEQSSIEVIILGEPTNADSVYMECRNVILPSEKASLNLPIKVYRNRKREHNEPYLPNNE